MQFRKLKINLVTFYSFILTIFLILKKEILLITLETTLLSTEEISMTVKIIK